jgi:hypothetical protein
MKKLTLVMFVLLAKTQLAFGDGIPVFDPMAIIQTTATAKATVASAQSLINQVSAAQAANQQLSGGVVSNSLGSANSSLTSMQNYSNALGTLISDSENLMRPTWVLSQDQQQHGMSPAQYSTFISQRIAAGDQQRAQLLAQEQSMLARTSSDAQTVQTMQAQIPSTVGANQSMQLMNTQLNHLISQDAEFRNWQVAQAAVQHNKEDADAVLRDQMKANDAASKTMINNFIQRPTPR